MKTIIGVIGAYAASDEEKKNAYDVGKLIAEHGYTLVTGGLSGVMELASKGASENNGVVIGILPGDSKESANKYVQIPIVTNMGHARNVVIAHTADALIAIGGKEGTLSEIAVGLKLGKPVVSFGSFNVKGVVTVDNAKSALDEIKRTTNV